MLKNIEIHKNQPPLPPFRNVPKCSYCKSADMIYTGNHADNYYYYQCEQCKGITPYILRPHEIERIKKYPNIDAMYIDIIKKRMAHLKKSHKISELFLKKEMETLKNRKEMCEYLDLLHDQIEKEKFLMRYINTKLTIEMQNMIMQCKNFRRRFWIEHICCKCNCYEFCFLLDGGNP